MAAPSVAVHKDAFLDPGGGTRDLAQITVATGDVCAVIAITDSYGTAYASGLAKQSGTATISVPANPQEAGSSGECGCGLFTFTVTAGGTLVLRVTYSGTPWRTEALTYVATGSGGIGNTGKTTTSTTTITTNLTASQDSYVVAIAADWNATAGATTTLTPASPVPVTDAHEVDGTDDGTTTGSYFSVRGGHWSPVNAGPADYGTTLPESAKYIQVACELHAGTGANAPAGQALSAGTAPAPGVAVTAPAATAAGTGTAPAVTVTTGVATTPLYAGTATAITGPWADTSNAVGSGQGTYATWADSGNGTSATLELAAFNAQPAVPAGATVNSVTFTIRHDETPAARIASVTAQPYLGATPHGSPQPLTVSDTIREDTITVTGLAYNDLTDLRVRVTITRT